MLWGRESITLSITSLLHIHPLNGVRNLPSYTFLLPLRVPTAYASAADCSLLHKSSICGSFSVEIDVQILSEPVEMTLTSPSIQKVKGDNESAR